MNQNQEKFCKLYAVCGNATRSYLEVYPNSSYDAARRSASDLLTNPDILAKIEEFRELNQADTILIVNNLKKRLRKRLIEAFDDVDLMMGEVRTRIKNAEDLTVIQLLNLSRIQSNEIGNFSKIVESISQLEGIDVIENSLINSLEKIDQELVLTDYN